MIASFPFCIFQLSAPLEILGKAAAELQFTKRTHIGSSHAVLISLLLIVLPQQSAFIFT